MGRPPKAPKVTQTCQQCGKQWQQYAWETDKSLYCSRECFQKSRVGKPKVLRAAREERNCAQCGKAFLVGGTDRHSYSKYCSRSCARQGIWGDKQHNAAKQMSRDNAIWLSGFFDGEGCISWPRRNIMHSITLYITNTQKEVIQWVADVTGTGRIVQAKRNSDRHSPAWTWKCHGKNAHSILRQIHPWLIVKKEAAEVALGIREATQPPWTQRTRTVREGNSSEAS